MQEFSCWRLEAISDRQPNGLVARFATRKAAEDAKSAAGGYGPKIKEETITIFESAIEFNPKRFDLAARAVGLAKLTERERVALGLAGKS